MTPFWSGALFGVIMILLPSAILFYLLVRNAVEEDEELMLRPKAFLMWAAQTFGPIAFDRSERAARLLEEATELAHCEYLPKDIAERIVARVYEQPRGLVAREIGQTMAMLECLAENIGFSADAEAAREFARVKGIAKEEWLRRHDAKVALAIATDRIGNVL